MIFIFILFVYISRKKTVYLNRKHFEVPAVSRDQFMIIFFSFCLLICQNFHPLILTVTFQLLVKPCKSLI